MSLDGNSDLFIAEIERFTAEDYDELTAFLDKKFGKRWKEYVFSQAK